MLLRMLRSLAVGVSSIALLLSGGGLGAALAQDQATSQVAQTTPAFATLDFTSISAAAFAAQSVAYVEALPDTMTPAEKIESLLAAIEASPSFQGLPAGQRAAVLRNAAISAAAAAGLDVGTAVQIADARAGAPGVAPDDQLADSTPGGTSPEGADRAFADDPGPPGSPY